MKKQRKQYAPEEKVAILRRHLLEKEPISKLRDFVRCWSEKTEIGAGRFIGWLDITASKFYDWRERYGNEFGYL
jgi:hypothetical protein